MRDGDQGDVVVPAAVGAAFEVVEAERVFELAVVVLDAPAKLGQAHERLEVGVLGEVGEPVLDGFWLLGRPLADQPADRQLFAGLVGGMAQLNVRRADPEREEAEVIFPRVPSRQLTVTAACLPA